MSETANDVAAVAVGTPDSHRRRLRPSRRARDSPKQVDENTESDKPIEDSQSPSKPKSPSHSARKKSSAQSASAKRKAAKRSKKKSKHSPGRKHAEASPESGKGERQDSDGIDRSGQCEDQTYPPEEIELDCSYNNEGELLERIGIACKRGRDAALEGRDSELRAAIKEINDIKEMHSNLIVHYRLLQDEVLKVGLSNDRVFSKLIVQSTGFVAACYKAMRDVKRASRKAPKKDNPGLCCITCCT